MRSFVQILAVWLLVASVAAPALAQPIWDKRPPYGRDTMTKVEKKTYWREFLALETDAERQAYWDAHVEAMQKRALERGVSLEDPPRIMTAEERHLGFWRPPYFPEMMTDEERTDYRSDLDAIPDRDDRRRYVADHIRRMQARAEARGVSVPSAKDFDNVFEGLEAADATESGETANAADSSDLASAENDDRDESGGDEDASQ